MKRFHKTILISSISFTIGLTWGLGLFKPALTPAPYADWAKLSILLEEGSYLEDVIESFGTEFQAQLEIDTYSSTEEYEEKVSNGTFDIISTYCHQVERLVKTGQIQKLNHALLPSLKNISPDFQTGPFDKGSEYSAAVSWGVNGFVYNKKKVRKVPRSWTDLIDTKFRRKVSLIDTRHEILASLVRQDLLEWSWLNPSRVEFLSKRVKSLMDFFVTTNRKTLEQLVDGELWMAQVTSGHAVELLNANEDLAFFVPEEGATLWIKNLVVTKDTKNTELAHRFVNYTLQSDVALATAGALREASVNTSVEGTQVDALLKPSYIRQLRLSRLSFAKDLRESQKVLDQVWLALGPQAKR